MKILKLLILSAYLIVITTLLTEGALRIYPRLIPHVILINFSEDLRADIANRLGLPSKHSVMPVDRDDGGPPLYIYKPLTKITQSYDDEGIVNTMLMDEMGFCNTKKTYQQETLDFVAIGDSFTFCSNVNPPDTWIGQISNSLGLRGYNLGVSGVGLHEYLQILKSYGLSKSPKFVILSAYEGNDLRDALRFENYKEFRENNLADEWPQERSCTNIICSFRRSFQETAPGRHSYALNLFGESFRFLLGNIIFRSERENDINFRYALNFSTGSVSMNSGNTDTDEVLHAKQLSEGDISLSALIPPLQEFVRLSKEHNFVPVVTYLPSAHTTYYNYTEFQNPELKELLRDFSDKQRKFFHDTGEELGYLYVDTTDRLQEAADQNTSSDSLLYFPTTIHFSTTGHSIVANSLYEELKALDVLP